ncbi:MAG: pyridoxamine 5'-phosphate oxidase [Planctomycetota bacterium]|jgi:pyridoxamine 5'-phosphate oxidase
MDFDNPPADPVVQCKQWLADAEQLPLLNSKAMTLATVDPDGRPSARMVLLKVLDERGAVFYTNRTSRKGRALEANSLATLVFYWDALARQVTIEGRVSTVGKVQDDQYFATRPRGAQIGAWASEQSQPIESRAALEARVAATQQRFEGQDVPRPPQWGGYRVTLDRIEFWQGRLDRLHDRVVYTRAGSGGWITQRLSP